MSEVVCPQCSSVCDSSHKFCFICGFPIHEIAAKDSTDPLVGTTLPGGYTILELVGVGGMGRVYRAEQKVLGRTVAVKIIHPHLLGDESASARFITEARAASRLNHPNSVAVIDFGKNGSQLYLVMEYLRGRDLARVVYEDGPLPFARIVDILVQVMAALGEAHHLGIVHRDLKPENIVLEPMRSGGDFVKVVDFGLAKMRVEVQGTNITSPGIVCGTPDYMAPEQGRGDPIDARSDLYACGVILFQLLTGRLPYEAESPTQVVLLHITAPIPRPEVIAPERKIPQALIDVTLKALAKEPKQRYQTADEFAEALRGAQRVDAPRAPEQGSFVCPSCRSEVPNGQKFCGECGTRIPSTTNVTPAPAAREPEPAARARASASSSPDLPLPLTGRSDDLDWLEASLLEAQGAVVSARVAGEPGVGKTRLLREFLDRQRERCAIVLTGPDPWAADVGYWAVAKAIREFAGLPDSGGEPSDWTAATPEARRGLMEVFGRGERSPSRHGAWSEPIEGALTADDRRFLVAEALRWAVGRARATRGRPFILAVDDLQAVDGASRNALFDLLSEPPLVDGLLLATHVPSFEPGWPGQQLRLGGLPTATAAALMRSEAPPKSASDTGRTLPPLYVDQLVRFHLEGGTEAPPRLADLITQRIERLSRDARRVLQAITVAGDDSSRATIASLLPELATIDEAFGALIAAGMMETSDERVRLSHPLIRDVANATIPAAVRRELHARASEDDTRPLPLEVRALHAYNAQNAFEALMLLEQVAERADTRGDLAGSTLALRRGLDLARREIFRGELEDPVRAVLIFSRKLGEALARSGDLTDADGVLREALDLAGPGSVDRALVLGSLAFVAKRRERPREAEGYLKEAIQLARNAASGELVSSLERVQRELR